MPEWWQAIGAIVLGIALAIAMHGAHVKTQARATVDKLTGLTQTDVWKAIRDTTIPSEVRVKLVELLIQHSK